MSTYCALSFPALQKLIWLPSKWRTRYWIDPATEEAGFHWLCYRLTNCFTRCRDQNELAGWSRCCCLSPSNGRGRSYCLTSGTNCLSAGATHLYANTGNRDTARRCGPSVLYDLSYCSWTHWWNGDLLFSNVITFPIKSCIELRIVIIIKNTI